MSATIATHGKKCTCCQRAKEFMEFHRSAKASDGRASWCKACANTATRPSRKRTYNPADKKKWQLFSRYRLTPADVDAMRAAQSGKCALCPVILEKFHIDHCHNTKQVRGLLCHRCNIRLGGWDDIEWRTRAIEYLGISNKNTGMVA